MTSVSLIEAVRAFSMFLSNVVVLIFLSVFIGYLWKKFRKDSKNNILLDVLGKKVSYNRKWCIE